MKLVVRVHECEPNHYNTFNTFTYVVFQGCRKKEEGQGAPWQFSHSGGRMESSEKEEENVKSRIIVLILCFSYLWNKHFVGF